jgi:hypothetical protein
VTLALLGKTLPLLCIPRLVSERRTLAMFRARDVDWVRADAPLPVADDCAVACLLLSSELALNRTPASCPGKRYDALVAARFHIISSRRQANVRVTHSLSDEVMQRFYDAHGRDRAPARAGSGLKHLR